MKFLRFLFSGAITFLLIFILNNRFADIPYLQDMETLKSTPSLGKLLNPFGGFWKNAESRKTPEITRLYLDAIERPVEVVFDDRMIPHIFAKNENDLYFAQGYITARFRLWQMDFLSYVAGGRLSEIFGPQALEHDKTQRRIGMMFAAERAVEEIKKDELSTKILESYLAGVNAYIESLSPQNYPLEYKILGYTPEAWSPIKVALIQKYMAQDLSFRTEDLALTKILNTYGKDVTDELYRGYTPFQDPIIPPETPFKFKTLDIPKVPQQITFPEVNDESAFLSPEEYDSGLGSNNWAISADKSNTGYPILCNDPHLGLKLPSIWFEVQLVSPKVNVYGVTLPGAPGVIIGFNQNVSWGVTNVDSDVTDWYKIQFQDEKRQSYKYGEEWRPVETRIEEIRVKGEQTILDTVLYTHHGPIVAQQNEADYAENRRFPTDASFRWLAHEPSNDLMSFYLLNRAKNYRDYRKALTHYVCPAQNFVFADNQKDIAITPNGKFPLKWEGQGKFVMDGSNPEHEWQGWIPPGQNPHVKNPERGFVSSANQYPAVDSIYPYYLHWDYSSHVRGTRINEVLASMDSVGVEEMRGLQNDDIGVLAREVLDGMLKEIDKPSLEGDAKEAYSQLETWNYHYQVELIAPTIFEVWWAKLTSAIWQDEFGEGMAYPPKDITQKLVMRGDSISPVRWFDNTTTDEVETLSNLLNLSFTQAIETLKSRGAIGENWQWGNYRNTHITHLIPPFKAFSSAQIRANGSKGSVNALGPTSGPSWRMIVQLGIRPKAFVVYPGGQSGNPGSYYYDNFIETWAKGELYEALYLTRSNQKNDRIISRIKMVK